MFVRQPQQRQRSEGQAPSSDPAAPQSPVPSPPTQGHNFASISVYPPTGAGAPIQRSLRIGKSTVKPPFTDWATFEKSIPKPFQDGLAVYRTQIDALLTDTAEQPHTFDSYQVLLSWLKMTHPQVGEKQSGEKGEKGEKEEKTESGPQVIDLSGAGQAAAFLKDRKFVFFDPEDAETALNKGTHVVICSDHGIGKKALQEKFPKKADLCVFVRSCSALDFVVRWLAVKHEMPVCQNAGEVGGWLTGDEYVITQSPQMRGDMHDVLPALALDPKMKVALCVTQAGRFVDADIILAYYSGFKGRVAICPGDVGTFSSLGKRVKGATWATEVLVQSVGKDPSGARRTITEETTGRPTEKDNELYAKTCEDLGFKSGVPYLIINYRDSGHKPGKGREASHPELDTGTRGFAQIWEAAANLGFAPVPMGEPPKEFGSGKGPHLIAYWSFPCCQATPTRNKRQAEYGLLRYLAEHFSVRALAMRSGGTDAMVYAGIETISLDLAASGMAPEELLTANLGGEHKEASNRSWMRAAVRDLIMPGKFHQGFFERPRPEPKVKEEPSKEKESKQEASKEKEIPPWEGAFHEEDVKRIQDTIQFFFGTRDDPRSGRLDLAPNSPLRDTKEFEKRLRSRGKGQDATKFGKYAEEMREAYGNLYKAMAVELERENLVLQVEIVRSQCELLRLQIERLRLLLQISELELSLLLSGQGGLGT